MKDALKVCTRRLGIVIWMHTFISNAKLRKFIECFFLLFGFIKYALVLIKSKSFNDSPKKDYLGIVTIVKNESCYIREWIEYHRILGVNKFYIYDNDSSDNVKEILKPYIEKKIVIYKKISGEVRQLDSYNDALNKYTKFCKYMLFLDADEFLYCTNNNSLKKVLSDTFKRSLVGGLKINWVVFGSSGHNKKPQGLVTQNFIKRSQINFKKNFHIKTLCKPELTLGFLNPHYPVFLPGYFAINEDGQRVNGAFSKPSVNKIRINHYFTKSKEEFLKKRSRGMADNKNIRDKKDFYEHDRNEVFDNSMSKYKNILTKRIGLLDGRYK